MTKRYALGAAILGLALMPIASAPASAGLSGLTQAAVQAQAQDAMVIQAQHQGARRGHGNVNRNVNRNINRNVNRNVHINRNVNVHRGRGYYGGRHVYRGGSWSRPRNYWWNPGGAIAAGAAIGFATAAAAAAVAGSAPGPNYCWFYTDPSRQQGFWDQCP